MKTFLMRYIFTKIFKIKGGGQAYHFGKNYFKLRFEGKSRTRPDILRVVLGPCVQSCPCETSEHKLRQKPKSELKEIELSYCCPSIFL